MEKITDKVKSFEDACKHLGLNPNDLPVVYMLPEKDRKSIIAFYKLTIIIRALNEGWEPDWSNWDEWKYYNRFYVEKGEDQRSSGFRYGTTDFASTRMHTGSRLCFKNIELAKYATEQFKELYREYLLIL
jgi:hypothetical protein|nr:MAG TPA: hypothetical protein [Bacteriophage sp.]DAO84939.1 MAG TPA: hypothetical protein [Caudoviricetes sp.]